MTRHEVESFEKLHGQIESLHEEIGTLSKKSPNDAVNKFKLKLINALLSEANLLLEAAYKPLVGFDQFTEDAIPTNSDVTMVLAQYLNCCEKKRSDNIVAGYNDRWFWVIDGQTSEIRTASPQKLKDR